MEQSDCPGCYLHHSGFYDVEIHQLPAAEVERARSDSDHKEEIFLLKGQVQERLVLKSFNLMYYFLIVFVHLLLSRCLSLLSLTIQIINLCADVL